MSEFHLVSPLLDGFVMGDPISSHDGISCCPAIRENTGEKYIVKIISVPANQKQLDALLLTGAYPDAASATDYFKDVAEEISKEASLLKQLSKLEGFLSYEDWQIVPMEGSRLGYQVYLISPYRQSLEKYLNRNTITHRSAINLGLDLCAALSICRRAGFLHMDLKPSNIFMNSKREFRIGDLGFAKLNAMKYASLPTKYCSSYSPPELHDVLATLNPTTDIYAVGMILYQIYNNGNLPLEDSTPGAVLPAPLNADYELAEIIHKACDPNPRNRYQTPIEMGQALVSYMRRNSITDDPIVSPGADIDYLNASRETAAVSAADTVAAEEAAPVAEAEPVEETVPVAAVASDAETAHAEADVAAEHTAAESESGFLHELDGLFADETVPGTDDADIPAETDVTAEVSSILNLAEEVLAAPTHETSEQEAIADDTAKDKLQEKPQTHIPDSEETAMDSEFDALFQESQEPVSAAPKESVEEKFPGFEAPKKKHTGLKAFFTLVLLALIGFGGFFYYQNYYLLNIDQMVITSEADFITVELTTDVADDLLQVICTDAYGNAVTSSVNDHKAVFTGMTPGTHYKIEVVTEGFHQVSGMFSGTVTTVEQAKILEFSAKTGTEDGSAVLEFTVEGPEQDWILEYTAEGEETNSITFTGHTVTVNNLTVGKTYTFRLVQEPGSDLFVVGTDTLEFTAGKNVVAQDLAIVSCQDGQLNVSWTSPEDAVIENWTVRCYSENGYDETVTVSDTAASFTGISSDAAYTVEVTADGMTQQARTYVSTNPVTVTDIAVDDSQDGILAISWNSGDVIPEGGWLLMYSMDASKEPLVIRSTENTAAIEQTVPGVDYHLTIQAANGSSVFGGTYTYAGKDVLPFQAHNLDAANITASLCPTPDKADWSYEDIKDGQYTSNHTVGSKVSMVIYSTDKADKTNTETNVMFVIRDSQGNVLPELVKTMKASWRDLWNNGDRYCELDLPIIPDIAGQYTVQIFFDRCLVVEKTLNVID